MYERISALRKARAAVIAAAGVIGVGAALVTPPALAGKSAPVTEPIQFHNQSCGSDAGTAQIGSVTFSRSKGKLQVDVTFQGADANTSYDVELWAPVPGNCTLVTDLGNVSTDSSGDGSGTFQAKVKGHAFFISGIAADDPTFFNDSLIANL